MIDTPDLLLTVNRVYSINVFKFYRAKATILLSITNFENNLIINVTVCRTNYFDFDHTQSERI